MDTLQAQFSLLTLLNYPLRWLPRVITNIVLIERELENETSSISLKVIPRRDLPVWILLKQGLCFRCQFLD